jgi:hypothetical protein
MEPVWIFDNRYRSKPSQTGPGRPVYRFDWSNGGPVGQNLDQEQFLSLNNDK